MFTVEKNWQTTRPTIKERTTFMLNNELFSDVKFVVRKMHGESESQQLIPAHKFVLSIGSPVFEAMFYGELAETKDSIEMPDAEYESLMEFFRFTYSDEVNLSGSNVMGVLYLAKKYIVPSLVDKCSEYLLDNLEPSNVFSILPSAEKYEEKNLVDRCWKVIDKQTELAVKSDGFGEIERSLLETVVKRDTLTIEEIELFKAVDLWATKECERQRLTADGSVKRRMLGEEIVKAIRFPTMKQEDFSAVVLDTDLLKKAEIKNIIKRLSSVSTSSTIFPDTKRCGTKISTVVEKCCRLGSIGVNSWTFGSGTKDSIDFSVDKDIALHGLCFFGWKGKSHSVALELIDTNTKKALKSLTGTFSTVLLNWQKYNFEGFEVPLKEAILLKKNTRYGIRASIKGPSLQSGTNFINPVQCSGVTFTFFTCEDPGSRTDFEKGQFPILLFSL